MTNPTPPRQVPEALRLASALITALNQTDVYDNVIHVARWFVEDAAAELRRLHAENEALRTAHVEKSAEIEHVAGDVSKSGTESNMSTEPAPAPADFEQAKVSAYQRGYMDGMAKDQAQAASVPAESVQRDAERYRWLREGNNASHGAAWHVAVNLYGCEWDAAIDAAKAANGGNK